MIIADRKAPFGVVIDQKLGCGSSPPATWFAVGTGDRRAHGFVFLVAINRAKISAVHRLWPQ
jgi:hypothetical protein